MLALPFLFLAAVRMVSAAPASGNTGSFSLLDIVNSESATAFKAMIGSSGGHTYIKPDLSDVKKLKVFIIDGNDDTVITHMEAATNANAAAYKKMMYGEIGSRSHAEATDPS